MNVLSSKQTAWHLRADLGSGARLMLKPRKYRPKNDQLTAEQQELAARFLPLARGLSKPLKLMYPYWHDEFESASCMALVEAARSFDPAKRIRFTTFARIRIRGALRDACGKMILPGLENQVKQPGMVSLTPFNYEHGKVLVANEPARVGADVDDVDQVEHYLRKLPRRHAQVCRLYYLHGKSQAEIAEAVGCSQSEVTRLHRKAIDLLSEPYTDRAFLQVRPLHNRSTRYLNQLVERSLQKS